MSSLTRLLWVLLALVPLTAANAQERADKVLNDDWMSIYINGQKVGHVNARMVERETEDGVVYVSTNTQQISLARGTTRVTIATTETVTENKAGRLVAYEFELDQGRVKQVTRGQVKDGRLVIRSNAGGGETEQIVDVPLGLCPHAVRAISRVKGYEPGTEYSLPIFTAQAPTKHIIASVVVGDTEPVEMFGVTKWLHREEVELSLLGLKMVNWVDDEGSVWLSRSDLTLFQLEMRKVSKTVALELADDVEIMVAGLQARQNLMVMPVHRSSSYTAGSLEELFRVCLRTIVCVESAELESLRVNAYLSRCPIGIKLRSSPPCDESV